MENKELKEKFVDERKGIEYRLVGDYYMSMSNNPVPIDTLTLTQIKKY